MPAHQPERRRFLASAAALSVAASASWLGYRYLNRPPTVSLVKAGLPAGHMLRDGSLNRPPESEHTCETLVLGSGAAALSAAWYLARHGHNNFLLAEGFERNGNNAAYTAHGLYAPTGAHYLAQPSAESVYVRAMLEEFGIIEGYGADGRPVYSDTDLVNAPDERLFYQGRWQHALLPVQDQDSRRFFALVQSLKTLRGSDGRKVFAIPVALSSQDSRWRALDTQTFAQWLDAEGYRSPTLRWYLDYCCRDDYGQSAGHVSAFAGLHYFAARGNREDATVRTWPDGLNHLSERLRRAARLQTLERQPENREWSFRLPAGLDAAAVHISENADAVSVLLRHNVSGRTVRIAAKNLICAIPLNVAARITEQPERYGFSPRPAGEHAPWLVSNFVLRGFPPETGRSELAWDNIVHGSGGLGYVCATHQHIYVAKPEYTLFTAYTALDNAPPAEVRRRLLAAEARDLIEPAAQDLLAVYGRRLWRHVEHIAITARGHAMSVPQPGYLSRSDLAALRRHRSRIVFAHSDLSGYSVFEEAVYWGVEAAKKILDGRAA